MSLSGPVTRTALVAVLVIVAAACGSGGSPSPVDGVVLSVLPDLSGEPDNVAFAAVPDLLVTDDGRVMYAAPDDFAIRGALVADVWVQTITPAGIESVRTALEAGDPPQNIGELTALAGRELGNVDRYIPETFRFAAIEFGPAASFDDSDTPVVLWPETASLPLSAAADCTRLPELEVGEVFVTAAEGSAFVDNGIVYGVLAAPDWPGAPCTLTN